MGLFAGLRVTGAERMFDLGRSTTVQRNPRHHQEPANYCPGPVNPHPKRQGKELAALSVTYQTVT